MHGLVVDAAARRAGEVAVQLRARASSRVDRVDMAGGADSVLLVGGIDERNCSACFGELVERECRAADLAGVEASDGTV